MNKLKSMIFCLVFLLLYIGAQIISSALIASVNLLFGTSSAILEQVVNRQIFVVQIVALVMFIVIVTFYQKG